MKTLKTLGLALVLALSLSIPAYGDTDPGDSHTPGRCATATEGDNTGEPPTTDITGDPSPVDTDFGFSTIADILLGLASIY